MEALRHTVTYSSQSSDLATSTFWRGVLIRRTEVAVSSCLAESVSGNLEAWSWNQSVLDGFFQSQRCTAGISDGSEAPRKNISTHVSGAVENEMFVHHETRPQVFFAWRSSDVDVGIDQAGTEVFALEVDYF